MAEGYSGAKQSYCSHLQLGNSALRNLFERNKPVMAEDLHVAYVPCGGNTLKGLLGLACKCRASTSYCLALLPVKPVALGLPRI